MRTTNLVGRLSLCSVAALVALTATSVGGRQGARAATGRTASNVRAGGQTPAAAPTGAATPSSAAAQAPAPGSCEGILASAPAAGPYKADALCPAINSLRDVFMSRGGSDHAQTIAYTLPSDGFYIALAASMRFYKGRTITVPVGGDQPITLAGLDTLDEGNKFKRNKLGLILERIRSGDDEGHHVGKVCMRYPEAAPGEHPVVWLGSALLKYGLPALIKLLRGDPSRVIDRYDAMVITERGSGDQRTAPIRTITFVKRGTLPADCTVA